MARFVWADGFVDTVVVNARLPFWERLRMNRADVRSEMRAFSKGTEGIPERAFEVARFEKVMFSDGSFEYREMAWLCARR